jgi:RNA polymerase sigma factor (sigma-70 family)
MEPPPEPEGDRDMAFMPESLRDEHILEWLNDDVREAVESLPRAHRDAVIMADLRDMSYKEIAEALGCPLGTVMSRLHRGRRLVRERLPERMPEHV